MKVSKPLVLPIGCDEPDKQEMLFGHPVIRQKSDLPEWPISLGGLCNEEVHRAVMTFDEEKQIYVLTVTDEPPRLIPVGKQELKP